MKTLFLSLALVMTGAVLIGTDVRAQELDLLIKGGHVIDPKNNIDDVMDVGDRGREDRRGGRRDRGLPRRDRRGRVGALRDAGPDRSARARLPRHRARQLHLEQLYQRAARRVHLPLGA